MKPGMLVKFKEIKEAGDDQAIFKVLELRGDRVLVEQVCKLPIKPTSVYLISDLKVFNNLYVYKIHEEGLFFFHNCQTHTISKPSFIDAAESIFIDHPESETVLISDPSENRLYNREVMDYVCIENSQVDKI